MSKLRAVVVIGHLQVPPGPLYENKVKCLAFDVEMIFQPRANKTLRKKGCALGFILKVRVLETWKWPIVNFF